MKCPPCNLHNYKVIDYKSKVAYKILHKIYYLKVLRYIESVLAGIFFYKYTVLALNFAPTLLYYRSYLFTSPRTVVDC